MTLSLADAFPVQTARLRIRRYQPGDPMTPACRPTDRWLWPAGFDLTGVAPDFPAYYARYPLPGGGFFAVERAADQVVVGRVGLIPRGDLFDPLEIELAYAVEPAYRGQGYSAEAGRALADYSLRTLQLTRIFAGIALDNIASQRIAEKIGLIREADRTFFGMPHRMYWHRAVLPNGAATSAAPSALPERIRPEVGG